MRMTLLHTRAAAMWCAGALLSEAVAAQAPTRAPRQPAIPFELTVAGTTRTGVVTGTALMRKADRDAGSLRQARHRYQMVVPGQGTVVISVVRIAGSTPRVALRNAEGGLIRRADRRGKIWARRAPFETVLLDVEPFDVDSESNYQLTAAFDIDRKKELQHLARPVRPGDIARVRTADVSHLLRVQMSGIDTGYTLQGRDVLVTVPAYADNGDINLVFDTPTDNDDGAQTEQHQVQVLGLRTAHTAVGNNTCLPVAGAAPPGCLDVRVASSVGPEWLAALAQLADADVVRHEVKDCTVQLMLRDARTEAFALDQLRNANGVVSAAPSASTLPLPEVPPSR